MRRLLLFCGLLGCVGDSTVAGDGGSDATTDGLLADAGPDAMSAGDVIMTDTGSGDAGCTFGGMSLTADCDATACLHANQIACGTPSACSPINEKQIPCGSTADCSSYACCLQKGVTVTPGCPNIVNMSGDTATSATTCSTNTMKNCPSPQVQVCVTSAECFSGLTCQQALFNVNGTEVVPVGICQ